LSGNWTDFSEIRPEQDDEKGTLKVEQFRELRAKMGFGSHEGVARITLIPNADRMTPQAANSMLKLLEEPPRGWIFFLTASDPTLILPTVLSRCQAIRLLPLPKPAILELLKEAQVPESRREVASELAQGSWGKALKLGEQESWERRELLFKFLEDSAPQLTPLVEWASGSPSELDLLLNQLEHALSELVLWSQSGMGPRDYPWKNRDGAFQLVAHATKASSARGLSGARDFWVERALRVGEIRRQSLAPLNRKILVQDLLMPWLR
jgi:DNA polymerase-3 subunit delta'